MKNITKKQFIDTVAQRSGKTKSTCARIVDEMLGTIADLVAQDCKITFVGFGTFEKKYADGTQPADRGSRGNNGSQQHEIQSRFDSERTAQPVSGDSI